MVASALGCGLIGGIFFAFSTFIMRALDRLPTAQAVAAMQSINVVVINPLFLAPFFGTGLACIATATVTRSQPNFPAVIVASALYIFGTLFVTVAGNVPLNRQLARLDPFSPAAASAWRHFLSRWLFWNHIRTASAIFASGVFIWSQR